MKGPFTTGGRSLATEDVADFVKSDSVMQAHYSTVSPAEQRAGIGKVIQLFGAGGARNSAGGAPSGPHPL